VTFFDDDAASDYDETVAERFESAELGPTVDLLAELAADGPVLELAVGTGRVALPLARRGIEVLGIDTSEPMVRRLRSKPGGGDVPVVIGNMATTRLDRRFRLVYLVFNTISNLLTQDEQVTCFVNAAAHLEPGGRFLVENTVPPLRRLPVGQRLVPFAHADGHIGVDELDVVTQRLTSHHYRHGENGVRYVASEHRWVWPSELDLMARIAGMELEARWGDWGRSPFGAGSDRHVSVWRVSP
jgi:SAM-dependent methyltransferase